MRHPLLFLSALTLSGCGSLNYYGSGVKVDPTAGSDPTTGPTSTGTNGGGDDDDDNGTVGVDTATTETTETSTSTSTSTSSTSTTTVPFQPAISSVDPTYGSNLGGITVTLAGTFDHATAIEIDGLPATVTSQTATEITAILPGTTAIGWVDVKAVSGANSAKLTNGFQYWADGTGLAGTFGWMSYFHLVGGYWTNPGDSASAALGFLQPTDWALWSDYTPTMDTCQYQYVPSSITLYDPGAADVDLVTGATTVTLPAAASIAVGAYGDAKLNANTEVIPGASYDLSAVAGSADWPGFDIPAVVDMPPAFTVLTPNMDKPNNPPLVTRSFDLTWDGAPGDYMVLFILRQKSGTYVNNGTVTCAMVDDGAFTVPSSVWPDWKVGDFLHIEVGRVYESSSILPNNNAENRMPGIYWYYGGGTAD